MAGSLDPIDVAADVALVALVGTNIGAGRPSRAQRRTASASPGIDVVHDRVIGLAKAGLGAARR